MSSSALFHVKQLCAVALGAVPGQWRDTLERFVADNIVDFVLQMEGYQEYQECGGWGWILFPIFT
jgi:hypothetical protein